MFSLMKKEKNNVKNHPADITVCGVKLYCFTFRSWQD